MPKAIFFLLLILCMPVYGHGPFIFNRFSRSDGLNANMVNCVWQDHKGYLWIGTQNGLQRFDGRKFIGYTSERYIHSMPPFGIDQIMDAGNGKMWIRQGNLIGIFDPSTNRYSGVPIQSSGQMPVQSELNLYSDSKGQAFLCTHKTGLLYFNEAANHFSGENLPVKVPEGWNVNCLFEDTLTGDYWIGSEQGLAVYQTKTNTLLSPGYNPQNLPLLQHKNLTNIYSFVLDKERNCWIIQWDYSPEVEPVVIHYNSLKNEFQKDISAFRNTGTEYHGVFSITETRQGSIWFGGVNNLICYNSQSKEYTQNKMNGSDETAIKFREIFHIYEDREDNIWFSTNNGLYVTTPGQMSASNINLNELNNGTEMVVNAIEETLDGRKWIGTWENGILVFDSAYVHTGIDLYKTIKDGKLNDYKHVWDLHQHTQTGLIWSGCQNGAIAIFDPVLMKPVQILEPPVLDSAPVRQILEDAEGNLFFGTQKGRLAKWKNETSNNAFEVIRDFNSTIYLLYRDNQERIWVGTRHNGLFVMDPSGKDVLAHFFDQPGFVTYPGNSFYDVVQYNDSIYFVSTGFLNVLNLNQGQIRTLTQRDGLPGAGITRLLADDEGMVWFTTNNGLGSYNYQKNIFVTYNERNGIIMADKTSNAKFKMQNGELWFGGESTLFGFNPGKLKYNEVPPDVTLTEFKLNDTYISPDSLLSAKKLRFRPYQNSFTIYFSSLSYAQQEKLQYYYKMDGADRDWNKPEHELAAVYTTLAPGNYTFQVKCINMQGVESANITSLQFNISPRFYQTRWFLLLLIAMVFGLTWSFYRLRLTRILAVEKIRNKVARDLHDDVGSTLSTINILSSMAKTKLLTEPVKTSEYITKITNYSQAMMESMDDIVWSIKPDNDTIQKIVARMREHASSILEPKDVKISFDIDDSIYDMKLNMETRRDIFLIFKEAINNIAKYSRCTEVNIRLAYMNRKMLFSIADNGVGFDPDAAGSGNGLGNMKKRTEALDGTLKIISKQGSGTEISLIFPAAD